MCGPWKHCCAIACHVTFTPGSTSERSASLRRPCIHAIEGHHPLLQHDRSLLCCVLALARGGVCPTRGRRLSDLHPPQWQPISALAMIAEAIDGMLESAEAVYQSLQQARPRPHVLDDDTVGHSRNTSIAPACNWACDADVLCGIGHRETAHHAYQSL